jgi:hypothetical protein
MGIMPTRLIDLGGCYGAAHEVTQAIIRVQSGQASYFTDIMISVPQERCVKPHDSGFLRSPPIRSGIAGHAGLFVS